MSKPNLITSSKQRNPKPARLSRSNPSIPQTTFVKAWEARNSNEAWGVRNWLLSLKLSRCYGFFRNKTFNQILDLSEQELNANFSPKVVYKLMLALNEVKKEIKIISKLHKRIWEGGNVHRALQKLEVILPDQYKALLGSTSNIFAEVLQLIYIRLVNLEPLFIKDVCQNIFYKLLLYVDRSDSFTKEDKDSLRKLRIEYHTERRKLIKKGKLEIWK